MKRRFVGGIIGAILIAALAVPGMLAEGGGQQGGRPGARGGGQRMTPEQWREAMEKRMVERLQQAGVTDEQMPAVKEAIAKKYEAREAYRKKLGELGTALKEKLADPFISDQDLVAALTACKKAQQAAESEYQKVVEEQDAKIIAAVNAITRVKLFLNGTLSNGGVYVPGEGGRYGGRGGRRPGG